MQKEFRKIYNTKYIDNIFEKDTSLSFYCNVKKKKKALNSDCIDKINRFMVNILYISNTCQLLH